MRPPILFATAPARGRAFAEKWRGARPKFACVLGHTDICMVSGLSSAGVSEELRPLTPAADAEVVDFGQALCLPVLPSNPLGAPGPAGITRAALRLAEIQASFFGAGLRVWPATQCVRFADDPGGDVRLGRAVPAARDLFDVGQARGRELAQEAPYVVFGESVPGGTTTALAVLLALGFAAERRVSGSMPGNAHALKGQVVAAALDAAGLARGGGRRDPLGAVAAIGDPMQPALAGMAVGASTAGCDVLLAGGSQMLAVAALVEALYGPAALERIAVGTTRWIVQDPSADIAGLAAEISPDLPILAVNLDFSGSRHAALRAYEQFQVKEGVGAGGACVAALLGSDVTLERLEAEIDATYDSLLSRLQLTS